MTSHRSDYEPLRPRDVVGGGLFLGGIGLLLLSFFAEATSLRLPGFWYRAEWMWPFVGIAVAVAGWLFQRGGAHAIESWKPSRPGRRFHRLVIYTRPDCHLCDVAKDTLHSFEQWLPAIEEINIDGDQTLVDRYGTTIPVVEIDGEERFRGIVSIPLLKRLIEGSAPVADGDS